VSQEELVHRQLTRKGFLKKGGAGLAGALLLGAAGCGGGSKNSSSGAFTWWDYYQGTGDNAVNSMIRRYTKTHPSVKIKRQYVPFASFKQKLLQGATTGQLPDFVVVDDPDNASFAKLKVFTDLTQQIKDWGKADLFLDAPYKTTLWEGHNYGVPMVSNCIVLWYNKPFLQQAGVKPPTNWDELKQTAAALTKGGRHGLAVSGIQSEEGTFQWLPFLWQSGADIPTINSAGGKAALGLWVDMVKSGSMSRGILNWAQADVLNEFIHGRAAMMVNGPWQLPVIKAEAKNLDWGVTVLPKGKQSASVLGGENLAISTACKNVDAAWRFIEWMEEPGNFKQLQIDTGNLPSQKQLLKDPYWSKDPVYSVFAQQLLVAKPRAYGPNYPKISDAIQKAMQAAISGQSSVDDALAKAQETITPLLPKEMRSG
jgi:multiple sugar transport system substrate-binding protein